MHSLIEYVKSLVPVNWTKSSAGWITGNCPACIHNGEVRADQKRRGAFLFEENEFVYKCFNCKFSTRWVQGDYFSFRTRSLLTWFGASSSDIQRLVLLLLADNERSILLNPMPIAQTIYRPDWVEIALPENAIQISDIADENITTEVVNALHLISDRNLLHWTDWAYSSETWKLKKRVILPYRFRGAIVGYSARLTSDVPIAPKYIVSKPPNFVFNLDNQHKNAKYTIVTEGDIDAISIGGVALGTNSASNEQISLISQLRKTVILCPDGDIAGAKLIDTALSAGWHVSFPEWLRYCKDANEAIIKYGRPFVVASIIKAATNNPTKIQVLSKMLLEKG
jgi:hypothetical protein